ncbi:acyltransferase family protein [Paenibacillus sp. UNC451MF]|uniref:acyltransferase family protein n=1 Tax=Paenibacillus sp. UNC451MF TaxID=1449063 RepID=UPI000491E589|nr:acyltransferase [Paenibacillus sp. UNC451MF]
MKVNTRYEEMDSLRGIAATSVVLAHISIILLGGNIFEKLNYTPLHIFWLGHESVILFFILSGFVLSLPYLAKKQVNYKDYIIRRVCRILIPSAISVLNCILLMNLLYYKEISELSKWFNYIWSKPITIQLFIEHLFLLAETDTMTLNPVLWSLIHEMRISILFPLIMFTVLKREWKWNLVFMFSIPVLFLLTYYFLLKFFHYDITRFTGYSSYLMTPHYSAFFILGIILAKYRNVISVFYKRLNRVIKVSFLAIGFVAYMYVWLIMPNKSMFHSFIINDWAIAFGGSIFIIFSLNSKTIKAALLFKPVNFVGKISYSLYLYHMIVILSMTYILHEILSFEMILAISFVLSFIVASIMYYAVEFPSIKLGHLLIRSSLKTNVQTEKAKVS